MIAVVAGASGLVGNLVLQNLLQTQQITKVIVLVRRKLDITDAKLFQVIIEDFSQMKSRSQDLRGDFYFCCLGTTIKDAGSKEQFRKVDFTAIVEFAQIAKNNQARAFTLISSAGANASSLIFYNKVKGETEDAVRALEFTRLVIMRPGLLIGKRKTLRVAEQTFIHISNTLAKILPGPIMNRMVTHSDQLARRMVQEGLRMNPGQVMIQASEITSE